MSLLGVHVVPETAWVVYDTRHVASELANRDYEFSAGKIYNLLADNVIHDHSDVKSPPTARVLLEAIRAAS